MRGLILLSVSSYCYICVLIQFSKTWFPPFMVSTVLIDLSGEVPRLTAYHLLRSLGRAYKVYSAVGRNTNYSQTPWMGHVPMGHVPMGTTDAERCVERIQCAGSPPPSSIHHRDRTRTLVSWTPRHIVTPLPSQTPNENRKPTNITIRDRWMTWMTSVKTRRGHRYWYSP
jgi:hypothetical protein